MVVDVFAGRLYVEYVNSGKGANHDRSSNGNQYGQYHVGVAFGYSDPLHESRLTMNDRERELWVSNDEGLYNWHRRSRLSMRRFIRENREELDAIIKAYLDRKPG